jgi:hypothetical protein
MAEAGWYQDTDPLIARWYDGEQWTEDRVVMTDHDGPPPPPQKRSAAFVAPPLPTPPQTATAQASTIAPPTPVVPRRAARQDAKADAKASRARAKSMRPWFKKKRYIIPLGILVIGVIVAAAGGGGDKKHVSNLLTDTSTTVGSNDPTAPVANAGDQVLFPGRPDAQREDQERAIGSSAQLSGYTATVNSAAFVQSVSDFETAGYIKLNVTIANRDSKAQPYNALDWRLQTPGGTVKDQGFVTGDTLDYGDLVSGGSVTGDVVFEVGATRGAFFIIYKPDAFDAARGIWTVSAP